MHEGVHARGGTVAKVDVLEARGVAISSYRGLASRRQSTNGTHTLNVLCNALPDAWGTLTLAVGSNTLDLLEQPPRPLEHIGLVSEAVHKRLLVFQQQRVLEETGDLAEEGNGLLVELLRVANVGCNDCVEGKVLALTIGQLCAIFLGADGKLATHRILGLLHMGVDVRQGKRAAGFRG